MKILLTISFLLITTQVFGYDSVNLRTIIKIESNNNPLAYNKHTNATGLYQITPICLKDYNLYSSGDKYLINDMFNIYKAKIVAKWYIEKRIPQLLKKKGYDVTLRNILISYNCGISCVSKNLPEETKKYIEKYNRGY